MPTDSNGVYTLPGSFFVQNGDTVLPVQHNPPFLDVAAGLTNRIMKDGRTVLTGNLQMGGFKVTGMADGTNSGDAVNKSQLDAVDAAKLNKDGSNVGDATAQTAFRAAIGITKWNNRAIGEIVYVDTSLTGVEIPPIDAGFIELTAGLDGASEYNEGKLTGETITGSGATLVATAIIDDADSPMDGETINLINTEERVRYAGERAKAGDVFNDQMQQITGKVATQSSVSLYTEGAFDSVVEGSISDGRIQASSNTTTERLSFDSSNSSDARTGDRTRSKGQFMVAFLKYKDVA